MGCGDKKEKDSSDFSEKSFQVPYNVLFSNQFLEDLDKIWELRHWIPDPNKIEFSNCRCTPTSRFRG